MNKLEEAVFHVGDDERYQQKYTKQMGFGSNTLEKAIRLVRSKLPSKGLKNIIRYYMNIVKTQTSPSHTMNMADRYKIVNAISRDTAFPVKDIIAAINTVVRKTPDIDVRAYIIEAHDIDFMTVMEDISRDDAYYDLLEEIGDEAYITPAQLNSLEQFADRMLNKVGVDIEFTKHFADRMNDDRNNPRIMVSELVDFFKKVFENKGKKIKKAKVDEAVLRDIQKNLNLPAVIRLVGNKYEVTMKTIMRKKAFKTPDKKIDY